MNSVRKTVTARLGLWLNPRIDAATATNDFDLRQLRQRPRSIYLGVTPDISTACRRF
nr:type IV secretory system conjugative DNA transfer family protein [Bradyrhizobium sp. 21]